MDQMKETPAEGESAGVKGLSAHVGGVAATSPNSAKPDGTAIEALVADHDEAIGFLQTWLPAGPWLLAAIPPDGGGLEAAAFAPGEEAKVQAWLERQARRRNVYYHSNVVHVRRDAVGRPTKATKVDVLEFVGAHVDIDPRAGEDLEQGRARILVRLRAHQPPPTAIIDSGGGYQGLWRLDLPELVAGDADRIAKVEGINRAIALKLEGDSCHDLCHLLRLPGTINVPGAKKRAKGRAPALAAVVEFDPTRVYPCTVFEVVVGKGNPSGLGPTRITAPASLRRLTMDELPSQVTERTKMLIVQGRDPDDPTKYPTRSEVLFAVVCELVRAGCDDETIYSVITDPDNGISTSVLDKRQLAEKYALRQIEQAREQAESPELVELNAKHAVIQSVGGKTRIANFRRDPNAQRRLIEFQSFDDFRNFYRNRSVAVGERDGKAVMKALGNWWIDNPRRRQYRGICFAPGREDADHLNLWQGFGVEPRVGAWSLMGRHIHAVLADRDRDAFRYIIRWAAWAVQNPGQPAEVAIAFRGGRGTGKGTFGRAMTQIFGQHGLQIMSSDHFAGRFNGHLRDVCLLFADEAYAPEDRKAEGRLKGLITEPTIPIEAKGVDVEEVPNHLHVVIASNERWVVPAGPDERRFAVFTVSARRRGDREYFGRLYQEMQNGGLAAMLHALLRLDLKGWHPRDDVPKNASLREQKIGGLRGVERAWFDLLQDGQLPSHREAGTGRMLVATDELVRHIRAELRREDVTRNEVAALLGRLGCEKVTKQRPRGYIVARLAEARAAWDAKMFPADWDDASEWLPLERPSF